jgi:hypothetical protein
VASVALESRAISRAGRWAEAGVNPPEANRVAKDFRFFLTADKPSFAASTGSGLQGQARMNANSRACPRVGRH